MNNRRITRVMLRTGLLIFLLVMLGSAERSLASEHQSAVAGQAPCKRDTDAEITGEMSRYKGRAGTENDDWQDELESYDFTELEQALEEILPDSGVTFGEVTQALIEGDLSDCLSVLGQYLEQLLWGEVSQGRSVAWQILLLAVVGAVFTNLARAFPDGGVSQSGFFVLYMLLAVLLLTVFTSAVTIATEGLLAMGRLMTAFLPVFFLAVAVQGQLTAAAMYEFSLLLLRGIQWLYEHVVTGGIRIWVLLRILEGIFTEETLTHLTELLGKGLKGLVKTGFGAAIGFQTVQALLLPYLDAVKGGTLLRLASAIPGVGSSVEAAAQMALGTAALIRNGIGMAGLVILVLASVGPLVKLGVLALLYHALAAVLQPISDKRFVQAVASVGDGCLLLLKVLASGILLFGISIGIVCACFGRVG